MTMSMRVRLRIGHGRIIRTVLVLMMLVVHVRVLVIHFVVAMLVFVLLREIEPHRGP